MKKSILIILLLLTTFCLQVTAQNEPYFGGNGDGNSMNELSQYTFINPAQFYAYFGGDGDGNSNINLVNYIDANPSQYFAYFGGDGDGYSSNGVIPYSDANPPQFYAYFGGNGDGNATALLPLYIPNALPVRLLSFDGKIENDQSILQWKVSFEKDLKNYELQRSKTGTDYETLYTETIVQQSNEEKTYHYIDTQPFIGANYYRLQINDLNGSKEYSPTVLLFYNSQHQSVIIFPNPAQQSINLQYQSDVTEHLQLYDLKGSIIMIRDLPVGNNTIGLPIEQLSSGTYFLKLSAFNGINQTIKFIKQ